MIPQPRDYQQECCFCGKTEREVKSLVQSVRARKDGSLPTICNECVVLVAAQMLDVKL